MPAPIRTWRRAGQSTMVVAAGLGLAGCDAPAASAWPWVFATVAFVVVSVVSAIAGFAWSRWRLPADRRGVGRLLDASAQLSGWVHWTTDLRGRIADWRASADPGVSTPAARSELALLIDDGPTRAALRAAVEGRRAIGPLRVRLHGDARDWILAARPLLERDGSFVGHAGILRPPGSGTGVALIDGLVGACPQPVMALLRDATTGEWSVVVANRHARARLGAADGGPVPVPPPVQRALGDEAPSTEEGWLVARFDDGAEAWAAAVAVDGEDAASEQASFSYTVSHDLRAPIRVVEGFTRIVKEDYGAQLDRVGNDHLDRILGATARMNQMIDAMLSVARLSSQPLNRQPVNLSQLAGYVIDDLRRGAPEREVQTVIEPGLVATGDPTLLRLVLENLIGNAWKYTAKRSPGRIEFVRDAEHGRQAFVVRDNGAGFDMRSADRLFGLFQRLHSAADYAGTGVGLASVRRIVRRHGGTIWADAEPDRGAAFHFNLPA